MTNPTDEFTFCRKKTNTVDVFKKQYRNLSFKAQNYSGKCLPASKMRLSDRAGSTATRPLTPGRNGTGLRRSANQNEQDRYLWTGSR